MARIGRRLQEGMLALHRVCRDAFIGNQGLAFTKWAKIVAISFELRKLG